MDAAVARPPSRRRSCGQPCGSSFSSRVRLARRASATFWNTWINEGVEETTRRGGADPCRARPPSCGACGPGRRWRRGRSGTRRGPRPPRRTGSPGHFPSGDLRRGQGQLPGGFVEARAPGLQRLAQLGAEHPLVRCGQGGGVAPAPPAPPGSAPSAVHHGPAPGRGGPVRPLRTVRAPASVRAVASGQCFRLHLQPESPW